MLRTTLLLSSILFIFFSVEAQEITVFDEVTQQRIPGVKVYSINPKVQLYTDLDGRFQLEKFKGCDSIYMYYPQYKIESFTYDELSKTTSVELSDDFISIEETVVTANRWEQKRSKIPFRITTVNLSNIEMHSPYTTADLLSGTGSVFIQKSQFAGGSPQFRGFGTNRLLTVVDGVRMNTAIFRSGNLQNIISIDPNSLESAEILFGPGAVMYGSDAIGGVMDFQTKAARFSTDSLRPLIKWNLYSRYSSAANESTGHIDFNYGNQKWAFVTTVTYADFDDLRAGTNGDSSFLRPSYQGGTLENPLTLVNDNPSLQIHSGYDQLNVLQKVAFKPKENSRLEYGFIYSTTSDAPRYDRLIQDDNNDDTLDYSMWYYGPQKWMMHRISFENRNKTKLFSHYRVNVAYQNFEESRHDLKYGENSIRHQYENVDAYSVNLDFEKALGSRSNLFYGGEYVMNVVTSEANMELLDGDSYEINPRYPSGSKWQAGGLYINAQTALNEKLSLHTGFRYSYFALVAKFDTTLFAYPTTKTVNDNGAFNGNTGIVWNPSDHSQIYSNFNTGFRAPNIDDIGKVFDSSPGVVVVPHVDLKPEYAYSVELGFNHVFYDKVRLDGTVYYTYLKDALARVDSEFNGQDSILYQGVMSKVQAIQNLSNAYVYGIQTGIEIRIVKGLSLLGSFNYQQGFDYIVDSAAYFPKSHSTPIFGKGTIRYKQRHVHAEFYVDFNGRMDPDELALNERDKVIYAQTPEGENYVPAWYTLNFKISYFFNKHISLNGGIENITDQLYRTAGSGISAPGRNFMISLKGSF